MNLFRRQQLRGFLVTLLTAALLIAAFSFTVIGYGAGEGAKQQIDAIDSRYLTIGIVREQASRQLRKAGLYCYTKSEFATALENGVKVKRMFYWMITDWLPSNYEQSEDGSILWEDGTQYYSASVLADAAADASQVLQFKHNGLLSAHVEGVYGLSSASLDSLHYDHSFDDHCYNFGVFTVGVFPDNDPDNALGARLLTFSVTGDKYDTLTYHYNEKKMYFIDSVSLHPAYEDRVPVFRQLTENQSAGLASVATGEMKVEFFAADGTLAFEEGKQYILRGFLWDYPIIQARDPETGTYVYRRYDPNNMEDYKNFDQSAGWTDVRIFPSTQYLYDLHTPYVQEGTGEPNFTYDIVPIYTTVIPSVPHPGIALIDDGLPYYAEFTGTVEEFLASEEGSVWREEIIPWTQINQQSASVMLIDGLDYLYSFNTGDAKLLKGRAIEQVEYDKGSPVCMISAAYAEVNGLEIGDTLNLDFYDTGYFLMSGGEPDVTGASKDFVVTHNPLQEHNRIGFEQEYKIVGIYMAPEFEVGTHSFRADTIFVPKNSVPNAEKYEDHSLPMLNTVILRNGTTEEFEAYMAEQGFGGYYQYYDHDYSSNIAGFEAMLINAQRLLLIGLVVLVITAVLFYYLNFRRMIPVARTMRKLGQSRFLIWWQIQWVTIPLVVLSVLAGGVLGVYAFEYVTQQLLQTNVILDVQAVQQITLFTAAALSLPPLFLAIPIATPSLMKRK